MMHSLNNHAISSSLKAMTQTFRGKVYYAVRTLLFCMLTTFLLPIIPGYLMLHFRLGNAGVITCKGLVFMSLPVFFIRRVKSLFTKEIAIRFSEDGIVIATFYKSRAQHTDTWCCKWTELKRFKFYYGPNSGAWYLDLHLRHKLIPREYAIAEKPGELLAGASELEKIFRTQITSSNASATSARQITG